PAGPGLLWRRSWKGGASRLTNPARRKTVPSSAVRRRPLGGQRPLQAVVPLALGGQGVHPRAVDEGALGGRDVLGLAAPGLLRRGLQGAAVGEGHLPGEAADLVHRVEVGGGLLVRLAAGEVGDARNR